jgi:AAA+ superfamily predicted ATPase
VLLREPSERLRKLDAFRIDAPLARNGLIRLRVLDDLDTEVTPTRRAMAALMGRHPLDELPEWAQLSAPSPPVATWTEITPGVVARAMGRAESAAAVCIVRGASGSGRSTWARTVAHAFADRVVVVDVPRALAYGESPMDALFDFLEDCAISQVPVILDDADQTSRSAELQQRLADFVDRAPSRAFIILDADTAVFSRLARRVLFDISISAPPAAVRRELWGNVPGAETIAEEIVLGPSQILNARRIAERTAVDPLTAALWQIDQGRELLQSIRNAWKLEDLVVSNEIREELTEIINAIRTRGHVLRDWGLGARSSRGRGISALFDGDSGTGKTMACDVLAAEVQLPLMRVNVATLVDKYIGETEKNLARVFAQARARGGILLFDEADALFGHRVDVGRAQDRYANLETNLLLQLMEDHPGIVFLTTNLRRNMDQAFMRRITFKVYFEIPDGEQREALWRRHIPPGHAEDVDVDALSEKFELSGGAIRNAVIRACYRAAAEGRKLRMNDLVECARLETAASGKVASW